jgi:hypothetical protein
MTIMPLHWQQYSKAGMMMVGCCKGINVICCFFFVGCCSDEDYENVVKKNGKEG